MTMAWKHRLRSQNSMFQHGISVMFFLIVTKLKNQKSKYFSNTLVESWKRLLHSKVEISLIGLNAI